MALWLITDTHFGHNNMVHLCGRPQNFTRLIMDNWRKMVANTDTIIHLGDVAWGDEMLAKVKHLPGNKILVRGNHDKKDYGLYYQAGFSFVCEETVLRLNGLQILLSHHPHYGHTYDLNIHGHQHDLYRDSDAQLFVPLALETQGYAPLLVGDELLRTLRSWSDLFKAYGQVPTLNQLKGIGPDPLSEVRERDRVGTPQTHILPPE